MGERYEDFLRAKLTLPSPTGFEPGELSPHLFPFQRHIVAWAVRKGRAAIWADCGLGKTLMQLEWARQVVEHTGGRALVLCPLAVAGQTVREGERFGIDCAYVREPDEGPPSSIVVTNYERLDRFDASSFAGVVLDESSILKAFMGRTKRRLVETFAATPYKLACTATPAPNDHLEIGNHSEFLGVLTSHEMIARWFINDTSTFGTYRLKGHAIRPFWDWVASWAVCCGTPSDLGYSDEGYVLPELRLHNHLVEVDQLEGASETLFRIPDMSATSVHAEKRRTVADRAARVAELVSAEPDEPWLLWCETDYEADALLAAVPGATDVRGSMSLESKEAALLGFVDGAVPILISKPSLAGFGLNFQHCARVAFVGATFSYEQFYQAIRRAWRFGQRREVHVHVVLGETELPVWKVLIRKRDAHDEMKVEMFGAACRAQAKASPMDVYRATVPMRLPSWLRTEAA